MASRLPLAILLGWFALFAGAAPAWGCAAEMPRDDCCPDNMSSHALANACCAAVPAQAAAAAPAFVRVDPLVPSHEGSPDPLTLVAAATADAQDAWLRTRPCLDGARASADGAGRVYLRTSRLLL